MRVEKTLRNSITAIVSYAIIGLMTFIVRKLFTIYLPIEFLGYEGLFGNVFALLALADMGIETVVLYRLVEAYAKHDENEMATIMQLYKALYKVVGAVILVIGIVLMPILPMLVNEEVSGWKIIYIVYLLQLLSTLCTYFLAYKRLVFIVSQNEYRCVRVDTACTVIANVVRIVVIITLRSYIAYLLINVINNITMNLIISRIANKEFPFLKQKDTISKEQLKTAGYTKDIKNNIIQKVSGTIYGGTDNILISMFLGIKNVALVSNYMLVSSFVTTILTKVLHPFQAVIGNIVHSEDSEKNKEWFYMFDLISFFIGCFISISYAVLYNDFIVIWLGKDFLLPLSFVLFFALNQYVMWNHQLLTYYRYSFGQYEIDKYYILVGAILNIVCSIMGAKLIGIAGIMLGTVIGHLGFWIGRVKVVQVLFIKEKESIYWKEQIKRLLIFFAELAFMMFICMQIETSIMGMMLKVSLCVIVPNLLNVVFFYRTAPMKMILVYVERIWKMVLNKVKISN